MYSLTFIRCDSYKNLSSLIKLQRKIKTFLKKLKKEKEEKIIKSKSNEKGINTPKEERKSRHRPNQSSIRFKSNVFVSGDLKKYSSRPINIDEEDIKYVENFQIDNVVYTGEMVRGMRHGKGVQVWDDGAKYDGEWKLDKASGYGTFYHIDGDIYQGNWDNDKANGEGTYINSDGATYQGEWKEDIQDGYGIEVWNDNSTYKGYYKQGKKDGFGAYVWPDGNKYEGDWVMNKLHGKVFKLFYIYRAHIPGSTEESILEILLITIWMEKVNMSGGMAESIMVRINLLNIFSILLSHYKRLL